MSLQTIAVIIASLVPVSFFLAALANEKKARWKLAERLSLLGLIVAVVLGIGVVSGWFSISEYHHWIGTSLASLVMLGLVSLIAFINIRYSSAYMAGNVEEEKRYLRWLLITLGSVATVVISNHMLVFMLAWVAISLSLHRLLLFFPNRQRAVLAAYKKAIFARTAEVFLLAAMLLLFLQHDTWFISEIFQNLSQANQLSTLDQVAAICIALAALIKCAQLPLHGWLIQVVEAPTPVSALLHAGIINLGGYLLIAFAPLIMLSNAAQWLLLIVGGLTTVLAALVMMTRATVKVRLAWSTMSQMGLMIVECALGLFELALLHLVAHSFYKAYAFLNSGSEVETSMKRRMAPSKSPTFIDWTLATIFSVGLVIGLILLADIEGPYSPWLLFALALILLIAERHGRLSASSLLSMVGLGAVLLAVYTLQKAGAGFIVPGMPASVGWLGDAWISVLFVLFMLIYILLRYHAERPALQKIRRAFYAGFYLDELVTRLNLRIYPTRLPVRQKPKKLQIAKEEFLQ